MKATSTQLVHTGAQLSKRRKHAIKAGHFCRVGAASAVKTLRLYT
jgi:hypothetical protein